MRRWLFIKLKEAVHWTASFLIVVCDVNNVLRKPVSFFDHVDDAFAEGIFGFHMFFYG